MQGQADESVVSVEAFIAAMASVLGFGFGVLLPQPVPHPLADLPRHFGKHPRAVVRPVPGSTAASAVVIGALADEPIRAQAPREAHGATREGARGPRDLRKSS
jgi:hypothetical protein